MVVGALVVILVGLFWLFGRDRGGESGADESRGADATAPELGAKKPIGATGLLDVEGLERGSIAGKVSDQNGAPLAGARVCARGVSDRLTHGRLQFPVCTRSGADGSYRIEGLLPARYGVGAFAPGYLPAAYAVVTSAGSRAREIGLAAGQHAKGIDLVLRSGGVRITGHVFDVSGGPIEAAWVTAQEGAWTITDETGAYELWATPGSRVITASANGYASNWQDVFPPAEQVDLYLSPEATIVGEVVVAGTEQPVAGIGIYKVGHPGWPPFARTDADGRFTLAGLEPGRYQLEARSDEYYGRTSHDVPVGLGEIREGVRIEVASAVTVEGRVVIEGSDDPCPAGKVTIEGQAGSEPLADRFGVGDDGGFMLTGVTPDSYRVTVECEDHLALDEYAPIEVTEGAPPPVELLVRPGLRVAGRVVDHAGDPVADSEVQAIPTDGNSQAPPSVTSAPDGTFVLTGLDAIRYQVMVIASPVAPTPSESVVVDLSEGPTPTDLELVLDRGAIVEGTVTDGRGQPITQARVEPISLQGGVAWGHRKQARTDAQGRYRIEGLAAGAYRVEVGRARSETYRHPGQSADDPEGVLVALAAGELRHLDIEVVSTDLVITGTVTAAGGPVDDAFIVYGRMSDSEASSGWEDRQQTRGKQYEARPIMTEADGTFRIEGLQEGRYVVLAQRRGGGEALAEGVVAGSDIELEIEETGSIEGRVVVEGGEVPTRLSLTLEDRSVELDFEQRTFATAGKFRFDRIPAGNYDLRVESVLGTARTKVTLARGEQKRGLILTLEPTHRVSGRLVDDESREPLAGLVVYAHAFGVGSLNADPNPSGARVTGTSGRFTVDEVPTGKVVFTILPRHFDGTMPEYGLSSLVRAVRPSPREQDLGDLPLVRRRVHGTIEPGDLGFELKEWAPEQVPEDWRAEVATVTPGGPADRAGMRPGDVIVSVDGHDVSDGDPDGLYGVLLPVPVGTTVTLGLAREELEIVRLTAVATLR
ncbi:MAG TPA: carboxypeptidase regulatory-like domain-containing protein [Enhygromyxa sp.]|nr:carboxypeptidase regulatory-like domain-containing protein [Enhygromyxa sp.]